MSTKQENSKNFLYSWLEKTVVPLANKMQSFKYVQAIRTSFLEIISFIIIGSFFILIRDFPYTAEYVAPIAKYLSVGVMLTFDMVALYLAFTFGSNLGKEYGLETRVTALLSVLAFFFVTQTDLVNGNFTTQYMGSAGLFMAIIASAYAVELYRLCIRYNIYIKAPKGVPPAVASFFKMLVPQVIIIFPIWMLVTVSGVNVAGSVYALFGTFAESINNVWAYTAVEVLLDNTVWFFGVHPWSILGPTFIPLITQNTLTNAALLEAGKEMTQFATIAIYSGGKTGGTGSTFIICVFCLFSKNKTLKTLGAVSILPTVCHINEPILFGLPIIFNPIWFIPFVILQPIATSVLAYMATALGWVSAGYIPFMGFLPGPLVWYLNTLDWRAIPWGVITGIIVPGIIYYPFFRIHEKIMEREEENNRIPEDVSIKVT